MNPAQFFHDDPEPDDDEVVTPPEHWYREVKCDACLREAVTRCYIDRGDNVQPARFNLCSLHVFNVVMAGGEVEAA